MYISWFFVIGFFVLFIVSLSTFIFAKAYGRKWYKKQCFYEAEMWKCNDYNRSVELLKNKENCKEKAERFDTLEDISSIIMIAASILLIIFLLVSIFVPLHAKSEIQKFENEKEYIEIALDSAENLDNITITQTIVEKNEWLAEANADLNSYGRWSMYWGTGIEKLEPIRRGK